MRILVGLFLFGWVAVAVAYHPVPVTKSAVETALVDTLANTDADSTRLRLAREALETLGWLVKQIDTHD